MCLGWRVLGPDLRDEDEAMAPPRLVRMAHHPSGTHGDCGSIVHQMRSSGEEEKVVEGKILLTGEKDLPQQSGLTAAELTVS